jgi:hypothetical protein
MGGRIGEGLVLDLIRRPLPNVSTGTTATTVAGTNAEKGW